MSNKIPLYGFNNLTKNLSFSLYRLHYLTNTGLKSHYKDYINEQYNSKKLSELLHKVCHAIGGNVLNLASQDYAPHGASVTLMISEEAAPTKLPESIVAHLDKSHLCIHTYPDELSSEIKPVNLKAQHRDNQSQIAIFRADIELSTCGVISPLKVLNYVINEFNADVIDIDYRIRGMTRNLKGKMQFIDQEVERISDFLSTELIENYNVEDNNLPKQNIFHSRLCRNKNKLTQQLFGYNKDDIDHLSDKEKDNIKLRLTNEMNTLIQSTN